MKFDITAIDDAVLINLIVRYPLDHDLGGVVLFERGDDGLQVVAVIAIGMKDQHIGQADREIVIADQLCRTKHGVAETERFVLKHRRNGNVCRQDIAHRGEQLGFTLSFERIFKLGVRPEVLLDRFFARARDQDDLLEPGRNRFFDHVLDHRFIDHGQHFLRNNLARG